MSYDLNDAPDVVALLRQHVAERPQAEAFGFLADPDDILHGVVRWSYEHLDQRARTCAAWLQRHCPPGSRVLLLYPNGLEFIAALVGCLYAGMIAVPAPLPGNHRHHRQRIAAIAANADAHAVLTTSDRVAETREWARASDAAHLVIAAIDEPGLGDPSDWNPPRMDRSTVALLQYTSGSTGDPKGVMVTHDNILANLDAQQHGIGWPAGAVRLGGWVPLYHDLALQGLLLPTLLCGAHCLLMEPIAFVRRPLRWLQAIDLHDLNVSYAPNFAYEMCVNKVSDDEVARLDLSRWHLAGNASEPVDSVVLAAFAQKFAPAGFREEALGPIYGLAEATAYVTGHSGRPPVIQRVDPERLAQGSFVAARSGQPARTVVSCGPPTRACEIRVVDPESRQVLAEDQLGEIWLRGTSISSGYWGRDNNAEIFGAATAAGEGGFLRTGDLGTLHDGELYVHGRLKDILIVHGRNIYPDDVERELRAQHPELGKIGAVFSRFTTGSAGSDARGVVVTHEVSHVPPDRLAGLAADIRHTVGREFGVQVAAVLLLRPGTVLRTTSGKVQRSAMRKLFHEGQLTALYRNPPAGDEHDTLSSLV